MWHFNVVFMLSHVVVTSGVNFNQIESVHKKMKIQDSTIYPSPTLCIETQVLHMIAHKGYSSGNPTSTRGITSSGGHWSSHGKFHVASALLWSLMTKGERNEQRYELSLDEKGGDEMRVRSWTWIKRINILGQEEHTSRGSKLMNLVELSCLHLICAYSCACLHLHEF